MRTDNNLNRTSCPVPDVVDSRPLLLAIGVVSTPLLPKRRDWLRAAAHRYAEPAVVQRFVVGCPATGALIAEHVAHGDLVFVGMRDGRLAACIEKSFAWWSVAALVLFPKVTFIAKTDDDSLNHFTNLAALLRMSQTTARTRYLYGGWAQFTSYLPEHNVGCGWSHGPAGALAAQTVSQLGGLHTNCRFCVNHPFCYDRQGRSLGHPLNATVVGPFLFATGALEIMSTALARLVFTSDSACAFVAAQRTFGRSTRVKGSTRVKVPTGLSDETDIRTKYRPHGSLLWAPWSCSAEDSSIGLAVYQATQAARVEVDFVSLGGLIGDVSDQTHDVAHLITAHKLEIDDERLRADAEKEQADNTRGSWQRPLTHKNATYRASRRALMRRIVPRLEALNATIRAPPRVLSCFSRADVEQASAYDKAHPCQDQHVRWCRSSATTESCKRNPEARGRCNLSCGVCVPHAPHHSVRTFLTEYKGYAGRWRFCIVVDQLDRNAS